jgi:hypothetical protein
MIVRWVLAVMFVQAPAALSGTYASAADLPWRSSAPHYKLRDLRPSAVLPYPNEDPRYGYGQISRLVEARRTTYVVTTDPFGYTSVAVVQDRRFLRRYGPEYYDYGISVTAND